MKIENAENSSVTNYDVCVSFCVHVTAFPSKFYLFVIAFFLFGTSDNENEETFSSVDRPLII